jgi:hypothetical protein
MLLVVLGLMLLLAGATVLVALGWLVARAAGAPAAAARLAQHLGWPAITPQHPPTDRWYGGTAHDRRVAIRLVTLRNRLGADGLRHGPYLRIVMEILLAEPLGVLALRRVGDVSSLHRFEEAFSSEGAAKLGPEARNAMLDFVARGYPTGFHGTTYRSAPGTRNLSLLDRALAQPADLHPAVLSDAKTVLFHDHPDPALAPDAFGKLLHELAVVAWALERGR